MGLLRLSTKNVLAIQQIPIYMIRHLVAVTIKQLFGGGTCRNTETDNYAVNVRLYFSLAVPAERAIGKINMHTGANNGFQRLATLSPCTTEFVETSAERTDVPCIISDAFLYQQQT